MKIKSIEYLQIDTYCQLLNPQCGEYKFTDEEDFDIYLKRLQTLKNNKVVELKKDGWTINSIKITEDITIDSIYFIVLIFEVERENKYE